MPTLYLPAPWRTLTRHELAAELAAAIASAPPELRNNFASKIADRSKADHHRRMAAMTIADLILTRFERGSRLVVTSCPPMFDRAELVSARSVE